MLSRKMRDAYEKGSLVRIILYNGENSVYCWVVGGQRSHTSEQTAFLTSDGFYSYTVKELNDYAKFTENLRPEQTETTTRTILAADIKDVEIA